MCVFEQTNQNQLHANCEENRSASFAGEKQDASAAAPASRVALGMSGGVDSSVAAALLLEAGYQVVGVTCVFVDDASSANAVADAQRVADALGIPLEVQDCTDRFSCQVIQPFVDAYANGVTPSPCVRCNVACKIPSLIDAADRLNCAYVATGHYARVELHDGRYAAAVAADEAKDQSYMLSLLTQAQLARLLMPLGDVPDGKPQVRKMAQERGLPTASKSDSQDICFINGSHVTFLQERGVQGSQGVIVNAEGQRLGTHQGLEQYTVGQRKGIGIGGAPEPYYVLEKRSDTNELLVGFAKEARMKAAVVANVNWQGISPDEYHAITRSEGLTCMVKLRYRQRMVPCRVTTHGWQECTGGMCCAALPEEDQLAVILDDPQPLTAPGQYAVLYRDGHVLAAGEITEIVRIK